MSDRALERLIVVVQHTLVEWGPCAVCKRNVFLGRGAIGELVESLAQFVDFLVHLAVHIGTTAPATICFTQNDECGHEEKESLRECVCTICDRL